MNRATCSSFSVALRSDPHGTHKENDMLRWAVIFFIVAIIAAIFGFGNISNAATDIARILFYVFLAIFLLSLVTHLMRGKGPKLPGA